MRHQIPNVIRTTAVLSVLVLIGLHLPLQAEPPTIAHGQLQVEADHLAQTSSLPDLSTLWAALVDQLIPSVAAQDIKASSTFPAVSWDDTDDGGTADWIIYGHNNSGTSSDIWILRDST